ncbi:ATP-binding protein [Pseudenhygromyxa sp. WMMC2535]|uniref:ATP-binding protein n=1 Tax=Pseudenhygromyxa sp. WMMC2535 TaxID=2712867 RepID=UPI0023DD8249|nr:ATP-binding protein [Pseudenhygromyxa sp. WMMC2535]
MSVTHELRTPLASLRLDAETLVRPELAVSDQGIGIAKGDLERIFERFHRVPEEAVRSRHGTGLGLGAWGSSWSRRWSRRWAARSRPARPRRGGHHVPRVSPAARREGVT